MDMDRPRRIRDIPEEPHPFLKGITMKTLLSQRDDNASATCIIVRCPAGSEIEEHVHEGQDDIVFVLEGEATMWIDGVGELALSPGTFVAVTRGKSHRTYSVKKDLLIYDVFTPPMF
jgi:quercetin dioxygenase-like cupin family protein